MFVDEKVIPQCLPTLAGFEDWFARQAPQTYDYTDIERCPLGQYYRSIGRKPQRFASELFATYYDQCCYIRPLLRHKEGE